MEQKLLPIHIACSDDENRPNLSLVKIKNGVACATDGTILVKIDLLKTSEKHITPDDIKILNGKCIHKEVWKEIHKCETLQFDDDGIYCFKNGIKKTFEYNLPDGSIWQDDEIVEDVIQAGEDSKRIMCYNPKLIDKINKIFQHSELCFSFTKGNKGTLVYPYHGCGMFAILMPMESAENRYYFRNNV